MAELLFVQFISFNPNLIGLDEKALDGNWAHEYSYIIISHNRDIIIYHETKLNLMH